MGKFAQDYSNRFSIQYSAENAKMLKLIIYPVYYIAPETLKCQIIKQSMQYNTEAPKHTNNRFSTI